MSEQPFWKPTKESIKCSNIYKMMQKCDFKNYRDFWKWSVTNKDDFWEKTVQELGIKLHQKHTGN